MEKDRGNQSSEQNPDDKLDKKKKRSKKASDFGIPVARLEEDAKKPESKDKEPTSFDEALAALVIKEPKEAEKPKAEQPESEAELTEPEQTEAPVAGHDEASPEAVETQQAEAEVEAEDHEEYVELPDYEPKPTEFSGGEVVIDLSGEEPVSERVVLLHEPEDVEKPVEAEPEAVQAERLSTEQHQPETAEPTPQTLEAFPVPPEAAVAPVPEQAPVPVAEVLEPTPEAIRAAHETQFNAPPIVPNGEQVATKQDIEDAVYYATKAGQRNGLVTGLFVAGAYEHFKHRRREKKAEKRFQKQSKQLEQAAQNYNFGVQEQERRQTEATARLSAAERRYSPEARHAVEASKQPEKLTIRTPEQIAAENPEQLELPPEHSLQRSAWHAIEIDNRTGKAVENPTFEYGEEFHKERAKESIPDAADQASIGVMADLAAASQIPNASTKEGTLPPSDLPSASVQGPPPSRTDKAKDAIKSFAKSDNAVTTGPIWPWLLALAIIVILLLVLL